ncbi:MAG: hypothetical protein WDW36_003469 [Sanguina aurantia]
MQPNDLQSADFLILGGGSLLMVEDESYGRVCEAAGAMHLPVYYHGTGSQYPDVEQPVMGTTVITGALSVPLQFGGVRGRLGLERFQRFNPAFKLPVIYDPALLAARLFSLQPSPTSTIMEQETSPIACFAGTEHRANLWFFGDGVHDVDAAVSGFVSIASTHMVVLLPVDMESLVRALILHKAVLALGVPPERFLVNHAFTKWPVIMAIMSRCSVVLTDRLHGAIISAASGTPFSLFNDDTSFFKQADFVESMGLPLPVAGASLETPEQRLVSPFQEKLSETFDRTLRAQRFVDTTVAMHANRKAMVRDLQQHSSRAYRLHLIAINDFVTYLFSCRPEMQQSLDAASIVRIKSVRHTLFEGVVITINTCDAPIR